MQIIRNDGRCEAVSAKLQNGELILEQRHDIIIIPASMSGELLRGISKVVRSLRAADAYRRKRKQPSDICGDSNEA